MGFKMGNRRCVYYRITLRVYRKCIYHGIMLFVRVSQTVIENKSRLKS